MAKYFDDFEYVDVPKKNGKGTKRQMVYVGDLYRSLLSPREQNQKKVFFLIASLLCCAMHMANVLQEVPSNVSAVVGVPAGLVLLPLFAVVYGSVVGLTVKAGASMEKSRYQETAMCRRIGSVVAALMLAYCTVALVIYTIVCRDSVPVAKELLMAAGYGVEFSLTVWIYGTEKKISYEVTPGKNSGGKAQKK